MKIVLLCVSGITSNILANDLQNYAKQNNKNDSFLACKMNYFKDLIDTTDIFLLAPQAKAMADEVKKVSEEKNIKVIELEEEEFVLRNVEDIYQKIEANRINKEEIVEVENTLKNYLNMYIKTIFYLLPILCLILLMYVLGKLIKIEILLDVAKQFMALFNVIFIFVLAYFYGEIENRRKLSMSFVVLFGYIVLLRIIDSNVKYLHIRYLYLAILISSLEFIILEIYQRISSKKREIKEYSIYASVIEGTFLITLLILIGILSRFFIS